MKLDCKNRLRALAAKIGLTILLLTASVSSGQTPKPPSNYRDVGACPFECCTYRRWSVDKDTVFYKQQSESSGVAFRLKKGDHVTGVTGVVITLKPGKVAVRKPTTIGEGKRKVRVKPGDALYLLHYMGEGFYKTWFNGVTYDLEMSETIQVLTEPATVWWVKVKTGRNQIGWTKETKNFGNMDACG